ncbi:Ankyrin repeat and fibronectin type-III domain-containing protein 1 [Halotydeus destructor]|nr:Ankyrin repeat and fibronectin type-III domain-containing protein 1 [Halotydeus destructor]
MLTEPESEIKKQVNPLSLAHSLTLQPPVQGDSSCSLSPTGSNSVQRRKFVSSPSATSFHAPSSGLVNSGRNSVASVSGYRQGSVDFGNCDILSKADRKLQEKLNKYNFHLQALFSAVEHEQVDRARTLLETSDVDVNSINTDGFSALDIAVMTLCVPMVRLLQSRGARESSYFVTKESKSKHLTTLQREAQKSVDDVNRSILLASTNGNLSTSLLKEKEKQLAFWCRRLELLQNLIKGYESIDCPDSPTNVHFEVVGTVSLKVRFSAPKTANFPRLLVTKYKIEWSLDEKFDEMVGYRETDDINNLEAVIHGLATGSAYYCRVSAGNMKGFSPYCVSLAAVPSSWRDLNSHDRDEKSCSEKLSELDELFHNIIESRPRTAPEVKEICYAYLSSYLSFLFDPKVYSCESEQVANQRKGQMRKSIKYLFGPTPKFQKVLKKGAYLGCLFYSQDKRILATNDDNLPIVEIDDSAPVASCFNGDFLWMLKISSTWEDIKTIRLELERSTSSSLAHFRCKLLLAVEQLQNALGVHDLGQLHYEPLRDSEGTTIICAVKRVTDPKSISSLSVRWLPLAKFRRKLSSANVSVASSENSDSSSANGHTAIRDLLYSSLEDMIEYNKSSRSQLPRGLYLGYLKLNSSVDVIRVLSFRALPNVLPYARIRENPHVSLEEWQWLTQMCASSSSPSPFSQADHREDSDQADHDSCTMSQLKFAKLFILAARALQRNLRIAALSAHRVFDAQIVELSGDVSFIILIPSLETVCTLPGQMDHYTLRDDLIYLPIQIFETIHMNTYQHAVLTKYSRISCVLEMDTTATHHAQREAFSSSELSNTKNRLSQLREFQSAVDLSWKSCRWLMDTINYARDKQNNGINFESLQSSLPLTAEDLNNLDYGTMDSCLSQMVIPSICLSTPQQLQVPGKAASSPRRTSRDDSSIGLSISSSLIAKNSSLSASSLQLFESVTVCRLQVASGSGEMRRCASTSGLSNCFLATSGSNINDDRDEEDPRKSYEDGFQVKSKSFDQLCLDKKSNQTPVKFQKAN